MKIGIITGASSGFGAEFARQIDKEYDLDELWLVARREDRLKELAGTLQTGTRCLALDLTQESSMEKIEDLVNAEGATVKLLINNAGFGYFKAFMDRPLEDWLRLVDLNSKAMVSLSYRMIKYMENGSEIYNTCSSSAFQPVPYIAVYGASKSFALNFTRAINMELKPKGIRAIAVCPHWTKTEFFDTAVDEEKVVVYYNHFNTPERVVSTAIRNMRKGKDVSTVDFAVKWQIFLVKHLPHSLVMKVWLKQQKKPY